MQILALGLLMGMGVKSSRDIRARAANRPVEVGYSTFLDLVDVNGKGHTPGKNPALKLENVVISKDRIGFRVTTDAEKHAGALLDKKLVQNNDVSVRPISLSQKSIYSQSFFLSCFFSAGKPVAGGVEEAICIDISSSYFMCYYYYWPIR